jgi:hypothetical protein
MLGSSGLLEDLRIFADLCSRESQGPRLDRRDTELNIDDKDVRAQSASEISDKPQSFRAQ